MSLARYRRLLRLARQDAELYSWAADGLVALESGDDLAAALGLGGHTALRRRNDLLAAVAQLAAPGKLPYQQAGVLLPAIARAELTNDRSELSRMIRDAAIYRRIPKSQNGLYDAITAGKID